jgi:hypothetical protein
MEVEEIKEEATVEKPAGRAAWLEKYKSKNPESGDPDDDALLGFADSEHSELDGKYGKLNGANTRLAELVAKDPKLGAALSMIAGEDAKSLPYAIGSVYGREPFEGDMEEFEAGYREHLERLAESENERAEAVKNIEKYQQALEAYGKENQIEEGKLDEVHQAVMQLADNFLMGLIPAELIDLVYKGLNHDQDVQEAADTGFVEAKNERVEAKMKSVAGESAVPDLKSGSGAGGAVTRKPPKPRGASVFDELKEIPGTGPGRGNI